MIFNSGTFVISLDFELFWGVRDKKTIENYGANLRGVQTVLPKLLHTFKIHKINATFSTVGLLFFNNKQDLLNNIPEVLPVYRDENLSPYMNEFDLVGEVEEDDPYHFASKLIKLIQTYPNHEIGTHTFSHYYCLEPGQTSTEFNADIMAAQKVAEKYDLKLTSLIFPRNQFNDEYLQICKNNGITCFRGNEKSWLYKARNGNEETLLRRAIRIIDAYINISGHNCSCDEDMKNYPIVNIPSSRFLRPYSKKLKWLDSLRLNRIKRGMTYAAKNNLTYHLWWHPHNFGTNQDENFLFLNKILSHYSFLNLKHGFKSYTMTEMATKINKGE